MTIIKTDETKRFLKIVKDLKRSYKLYDVHAHFCEIFSHDIKYSPHPNISGLYTVDRSLSYLPPKITDFFVQDEIKTNKIFENFRRPPILRKKLRKIYTHTGPKVFEEHMILCGVDEVLLLPVAPFNGTVEKQMIDMQRMFGNNDKFSFAWSVPNVISNHNIYDSTVRAIQNFNIKAIKLHPNITGIDLTSTTGIERVESILHACEKQKLTLLVHGGKSPLAGEPKTRSFSTINNLEKINWKASSSPVVICHGGFYGCAISEIENDILPKLKKLLSTSDNIVVDVSGLDINAMVLLLKNIDSNRVLFGSDALYEPQWQAIVKLMISIDKITKKHERMFLAIVHKNPEKYIFKRNTE